MWSGLQSAREDEEGMERLFFCVCGTASSGSARGSIDGFKSAREREREQTKPKEEREEMREGRREKAGSKQIKRRDFISLLASGCVSHFTSSLARSTQERRRRRRRESEAPSL